jgi:EAL domain-containing protein (putative c-di-GMP-specific phosphodiesterase class I)
LAEGVENAEQLTFLKALSCKYAQGYYISRPMRASNVAEFLEYWKNTHKL